MVHRNKVAVITGGGSGIGRAMAGYFVDQGYGRVAILDVDRTAGQRVAAELASQAATGSGTVVQFVPCDVSSWDEQAAAFASVNAACKGHGIDVVVANAGISEQGVSSMVTALLGSDDGADAEPTRPSLRTLDINLTGVIYTVKLATHYMRKNNLAGQAIPSRGTIICTASNAGLYPFPAAPLYATSKFGVVGLVRAMAAPLERIQVQINALAPAVLVTNIAPDSTLFENMAITPMSTLIRGVDQVLSDPAMTGAVLEIHGASVTVRPPHAYVDRDTENNLSLFWSLGFA